MTNNQKFLAGILLGAAAGTLATMFLKSEKGKQMLSDIKDAANEVAENLGDTAKALTGLLSGLSQNGKEVIEDLESEEVGK